MPPRAISYALTSPSLRENRGLRDLAFDTFKAVSDKHSGDDLDRVSHSVGFAIQDSDYGALEEALTKHGVHVR